MSIDLNPSESEIDPQKTTTFSQTSHKENPFFVVIKAKQKSLEYHIALSHLLRSYRTFYCILYHFAYIAHHISYSWIVFKILKIIQLFRLLQLLVDIILPWNHLSQDKQSRGGAGNNGVRTSYIWGENCQIKWKEIVWWNWKSVFNTANLDFFVVFDWIGIQNHKHFCAWHTFLFKGFGWNRSAKVQ